MSLTAPWLLWLVAGLAVLLLILSIRLRSRLGLIQVATALIATVVVVLALAWAQNQFSLVPAGFPSIYYAWIAVPTFGLGLLLATTMPAATALLERLLPGLGHRAAARRPRWLIQHTDQGSSPRRIWWRATAALLAIPLGLTAVAIKVNQDYDYYPTWASLFSTPADNHAGFMQLVLAHRNAVRAEHERNRHHLSNQPIVTGASVHALASGPIATYGTAYHVPMPGSVSHFDARPGWIWVPSSYLRNPTQNLPVIMLLAGSPGFTNDWIRAGHADLTADDYASRHGGVAPVIVMPDDNGTFTGDSECVNSSHGNVETYLTADVPAFLHKELGVTLAHNWAVAGLSEGGTCAAMLALRHPALFAAFADYSGLTSPTLSDKVNPALTTQQLFAGDRKEYDEHDPLWLLDHHPTRGLHTVWVVGTHDGAALRAQDRLTALARSHGLPVWSAQVHNGAHSFALWSQAFAMTLPVLIEDLSRSEAA